MTSLIPRRLMWIVSAALFPLAAPAQDFNTAPPNAPSQSPAFPGQTRAPVMSSAEPARQVVARLDSPWGMAELPEGGWIVTEKAGRLRIVAPEGTVSEPIAGVPEVDARGQGGLLDVVLADDFATSRQLFWSFSEPREGGNATAVATGILSPDGTALSDVRVIFQQNPAWNSDKHFGSRLVLDGQGGLFVTTGERSVTQARPLAQDPQTGLGKVIRIDLAADSAEVWTIGHRNIQSAAIAPDGRLWVVEHGARGGDELNLIEKGKNYGWPVASYGVEYSGGPIGQGATVAEGTEQPVYYWDPVIAPSGMAFYDGALFPDWQGDALIGGLRGQALVRLKIEDGKVTGEARYLQGQGRIRDVAVARDGAVMVLTDGPGGALIRLTPGEDA
jgi:Glucose/sorbosone dehydrogenases